MNQKELSVSPLLRRQRVSICTSLQLSDSWQMLNAVFCPDFLERLIHAGGKKVECPQERTPIKMVLSPCQGSCVKYLRGQTLRKTDPNLHGKCVGEGTEAWGMQ